MAIIQKVSRQPTLLLNHVPVGAPKIKTAIVRPITRLSRCSPTNKDRIGVEIPAASYAWEIRRSLRSFLINSPLVIVALFPFKSVCKMNYDEKLYIMILLHFCACKLWATEDENHEKYIITAKTI